MMDTRLKRGCLFKSRLEKDINHMSGLVKKEKNDRRKDTIKDVKIFTRRGKTVARSR